MQGYGPITISQGQVVSQGMDPATDRVLISNRSSQDVFVSFQPGQPLAATTLGQAWPVIVHAGDQVVFTLRNVDRSLTPLGAYWTGTVWLCGVGQPGGLALNGNISDAAVIYLTALAPGDPTPNVSARPTWTDASSQQRVVTVPISTLSYTGLQANFNTGFTLTLDTIQFPTAGSSNGVIIFYFFGWSLASGDSTTTTPQLQLQPANGSGGAVGAAVTVRQFWLNAPFQIADHLPHPYALSISAPQGATQLELLLHNNFASVAGKSISYNISVAWDLNNGFAVPIIGSANKVSNSGFLF